MTLNLLFGRIVIFFMEFSTPLETEISLLAEIYEIVTRNESTNITIKGLMVIAEGGIEIEKLKLQFSQAKNVFEKIASFSDLYNPGAIKLRICQRNIGSETKKAINSTSFKGIKNGEVTSIAIRVF